MASASGEQRSSGPGTGEVLGDRYEVEALLGEGAFGRVYAARDRHDGRRVAVKVIPAELRELAQRQAAAQAQVMRLDHPGAVHMLDVRVEASGRTLVVMELVDGRSAGDLLRDGPLDVADALAVGRSIGGALARAHELGFLHRDVTPKNVLVPVGADGRPDFAAAKLVDFGVAGQLVEQPDHSVTTVPGQVYGTPLYMAPEQLRGERQTAATDVYGLGALLFALLYGRAPFERGASTVAIVHDTLESTVELPPEPPVPAELAGLLRACLAKDPGERPGMQAVLQAVDAALRGGDGASAAAARPGSADTTRFRPSMRSGALPPDEIDDSLLPGASGPAPAAAPPIAAAGPPPGPAPEPLPASAGRPAALRLALLVALAVATVVLGLVVARGLSDGPRAHPTDPPVGPSRVDTAALVLRLGAGIALIAIGVALGVVVRRWIADRGDELGRDVGRVLSGARGARALGQTLALEVDHLVERCRGREGHVLGATIALMIEEYDAARDSSDRQQALMNTVDLVERLHRRASPWYVRRKELVAVGVSLVGIVTGAVEVVKTVLELRGP